jgi:hypothetical protein
MDMLAEAANPEYCTWLSDQGMLPLDVVKKQLRTFGQQVLPVTALDPFEQRRRRQWQADYRERLL